MRKSITLGFITTLLLLLAGCGGGEEETTSASEDGKTTLQFWHSMGGDNGDFVNDMVESFNDSQENIEVVATFQGGYQETATKLQQSISAGTAPDISMIPADYIEMFSDSEVLEDLAPYLEDSELNEDDFVEGLMGYSRFNDQLVSFPLNRSTPLLHVNKTILDEEGYEIPTTWDEMEKVSNALVEEENGEVTRYGLSMPYDTWYPLAFISQSGGQFFNDEETSLGFYDNGVGMEVFEYLRGLQETNALYYPPAQDSGNIVNQMFTSGNVAMIYTSTGAIGGLSESIDFDYETAFMPQNEQYAVPTGGANVAMLNGSDNKEAAWAFLEFLMTDPDGAQQFVIDSGYLPFTKQMVESDEMQALWEEDPNRRIAYEQLEYAGDNNKSVSWPEVMNELFAAIEAVLYDGEDIQATLDTLKTETERILESDS